MPLVMILAVAGIALRMLGLRYLKDPSTVDCTLVDVVGVSSRKQENHMAAE